MKVYVASRFSPAGIAAVREMHVLLRAAGHEITHDWTQESADGMSGERLQWYLARCAAQDLEAVRRCDALIFLDVENTTMRGAYVEFGAAAGLNKKLIVVGAKPGTLDMPGSCIFFMLPHVVKVDTAPQAVEVLAHA